ncbi:DNA-directed RNA polymerase subunit delta [Bacillus glycinifermentans]|uniref:Probable DNA-directed RNA polymerase subunit delta n=1 Tax=Bacillus glycinifermentans TaxID=1664069 RepID=A0A0J6EQV3_9BACI|nr:DNA-directed RNA polymerase subunit delta [Bacillus glycinifermentans]ATH93595.1 DNA-directed RNA polymerase subunit delta [Bacillus glycinifermentans]KMM59149.1 DNA-directed RNA polymerase subunit delta [Bacillus glycinifermentans]KRT90232.1 DNA-directed RNA polymerase subunit delta [Bacillus glycinifermentans]MEC0483922.1 DNA-directed RNA polymerase subunit delta [Bacillus glycinifermentans]MEC0496418.1 DNA-directed RNA polymerase subunit delta [Bacillus glycinifermentans]
MSLKQYSEEQLKEMSLVEIAYEVFSDQKKPITFQELTDKVSSLLGVGKEELEDRIAQFYTDLNIDGRFLALSDQTWGLRSWYPYDQLDEETQPTVKAKKKKAKKVVEEDLDLDEFEEVDEDDILLDDAEEDLDLADDEFDLDEADDDELDDLEDEILDDEDEEFMDEEEED